MAQLSGEQESPLEPSDLLVVFDFDETIIPCNSDTEVPKILDPLLYEAKVVEWHALSLAHKGPGYPCWTSYMDNVFGALAARGHTKEALSRTLASIVIDPDLIVAIKALKGLGSPVGSSFSSEASSCRVRSVRAVVVSDANDWFIDEVLC